MSNNRRFLVFALITLIAMPVAALLLRLPDRWYMEQVWRDLPTTKKPPMSSYLSFSR